MKHPRGGLGLPREGADCSTPALGKAPKLLT